MPAIHYGERYPVERDKEIRAISPIVGYEAMKAWLDATPGSKFVETDESGTDYSWRKKAFRTSGIHGVWATRAGQDEVITTMYARSGKVNGPIVGRKPPECTWKPEDWNTYGSLEWREEVGVNRLYLIGDGSRISFVKEPVIAVVQSPSPEQLTVAVAETHLLAAALALQYMQIEASQAVSQAQGASV